MATKTRKELGSVQESDSKYGDVIDEQFVETQSGVRRVALIDKNGKTYVALQAMYQPKGSQEWKYGKGIWIPVADGTIDEIIGAVQAMLELVGGKTNCNPAQ